MPLSILLIFLFSISFSSSLPSLILKNKTLSLVTVNSSDFWDNLDSPDDILTMANFYSKTQSDARYASIIWNYNQTYTGGTYNITYQNFAYNQTDGSYNVTYQTQIASLNSTQLWNLSGSSLFPKSLSYNVGIGTNTPSSNLVVGVSGGSDAGSQEIRIGGNADNARAMIIRKDTSTPYGSQIIFAGHTSSEAGHLAFLASNDSADEVMRLTSGFRVGIGNSTPTDKLVVAGNITSYAVNPLIRLHSSTTDQVGRLEFTDVSGGLTGFIRATNNAGNDLIELNRGATQGVDLVGLYADNSIRFTTNSIERVRINNNGLNVSNNLFANGTRVGIGTAGPTNALHVLSNGDNKMQIEGTGNNFIILNRTSVATWFIGDNSGGLTFDTSSIASGGSKFYISSAGKVGIGTATPNGALEIDTSTVAGRYVIIGNSSSGDNVIRVDNNGLSNGLIFENRDLSAIDDHGVDIEYNFGNATSTNAINGATIRVAKTQNWTTAGNEDAYMSFYTRWDGTIAERMRIGDSGNVGIGTTSPTSSGGIAKVLSIRGTSAGIVLNETDTTNKPWEIYVQGGDLFFYDGTSGSGNRVTFKNGGNVGIGTTTPMYPLHIGTNTSQANQSISVFAHGNISATGFITRTEVWDENKNALSEIKDSTQYKNPDGSINHEAFGSAYVSWDSQRQIGTQNITEQKEVCRELSEEEMGLLGKLFGDNQECTIEQTITEVPIYETYKEEGVSLGVMIAKQEQVIFEMKQELCAMGRTKWC